MAKLNQYSNALYSIIMNNLKSYNSEEIAEFIIKCESNISLTYVIKHLLDKHDNFRNEVYNSLYEINQELAGEIAATLIEEIEARTRQSENF